MKKNRKNILVTGANGFVGRVLSDELVKTPDNVFLTSRKKNFKHAKAKVFYGDLSSNAFCKKILKNIEVVYYLAGAKKNIYYHTKNPFDFTAGNVEPLIVFLKNLIGSEVKKIIYLSSVLADYNAGQGGGIDGYVMGKYVNELILNSFARQSGIKVKIVRSAPVYGPGDNFDERVANFIPAMIQRVDKTGKELEVWGTGKRKVQFIFIDDLVKNMIAISKNKNDFFVVGNSEAVSIREIVLKIKKIFKKDLKLKYDQTKPDKPTKLFKFINAVKPRHDIGNGLKKTVNYYNKLKENA